MMSNYAKSCSSSKPKRLPSLRTRAGLRNVAVLARKYPHLLLWLPRYPEPFAKAPGIHNTQQRQGVCTVQQIYTTSANSLCLISVRAKQRNSTKSTGMNHEMSFCLCNFSHCYIHPLSTASVLAPSKIRRYLGLGSWGNKVVEDHIKLLLKFHY